MKEDIDFLEEESELFEHHRIVVDPKQVPIRIDKYIQDKIANVTRNKVQHAIDNSFVFVNSKITKSNYKVKPDDVITISFPQPPRNEEIIPENIPLDIRYEDEDVLVVYKPAGMVVHPAYSNWSGTLVNGLVYHIQNLPHHDGGEIRPGLVHRIDKDTSGLLVIAKSEIAMSGLASQFFHHSVERQYVAIVWGDVKQDEGTIEGHVGRSLKDRKVMTVFPNGEYGKHAITHYKVLKRLHYVTVVACKLETGRTHQIRVHMKSIGHTLFGDITYGGDKILCGEVFSKYKQFVENTLKILPRQALHAKTLGFEHPVTKKWLQFDTDIPQDMVDAIERWEKYIANR